MVGGRREREKERREGNERRNSELATIRLFGL
jgi:hypothetical protein